MLIWSVLLLVFLLITYSLFYTYIPVKGICCIDIEKPPPDSHITFLDVRDYNVASSDSVSNAINIPYAYLKRYYHEVNSKNVIVIVSDPLLLNVTVRFLKRKNIKVVGYYLKDEGNDKGLADRKICF
jgi:hypothetical protein